MPGRTCVHYAFNNRRNAVFDAQVNLLHRQRQMRQRRRSSALSSYKCCSLSTVTTRMYVNFFRDQYSEYGHESGRWVRPEKAHNFGIFALQISRKTAEEFISTFDAAAYVGLSICNLVNLTSNYIMLHDFLPGDLTWTSRIL